MAGAPPLAIRVDRRGAWQAGVGLLGALAIATLSGWWLAQPAPAPDWAAAVAVVGCIGAAACAVSLLRLGAAVGLRWDGRQWWRVRGSREPTAGALGVAVDLGDWMLLRFVPLGRSAWLAAEWIPVQRRGLEAAWHALRCAVHAPPRPHETATS